MLKGISFPLCIEDIADGLIPLTEVGIIETVTNVNDPKELEKTVKICREAYWQKQPDLCEKIARELTTAGRVKTVSPQGIPNVTNGRWFLDGVPYAINQIIPQSVHK